MSADRWERIRLDGRLPFVLRFGVIGIGVPIAIALNVAIIAVRGDALPFVSPLNAIELTITLLLVAPLVGGISGRWLWQRAERRLGYLDLEFQIDAGSGSMAVMLEDDRQLSLAATRERLLHLARTDPEKLKRRAIALALLGYAYVIAITVLVVATAVAIVRAAPNGVTYHLAVWLGVFAVVLLSAMWIRIPRPKGVRVTRAGSPALFDALEAIQRKIDAPAPNVVLLDSNFNASVIELPRFGVFGLPTRYLSLGLPLLEAVPTAECKAILAHELAHLSRRHSRSLLWVSRVERTWGILAAQLEGGRHPGRWLLGAFARWYVPLLKLYAQSSSRMDEYEADALAAECTDRGTAIGALVRMEVVAHYLTETVFPAILRESADRAEPPRDAVERMGVALRSRHERRDLLRWITRAMSERTLDAHSHPSLTQRVERLAGDGRPPSIEQLADQIGEPHGSGADDLIGRRRIPRVRERVAQEWQTQMLGVWRGWHELARASRENPATSDERFSAAWARARWSVDCEPRPVAIGLLHDVLRERPDNAEAAFHLGRLLLESDAAAEQEEGLRLLEEVIARDVAVAAGATSVLEPYYARHGRQSDVERVQARARQLENAMLRTFFERQTITINDAVAPVKLQQATMESIRHACASRPEVVRAYLVKKRTVYFTEQPCVILALELRFRWFRMQSQGAQIQSCTAILAGITPDDFVDFTVLAIEPHTGLVPRLQAVLGAEIYRAGRG
ncbi:MAG TPA: M48 family metallopeptidase [Gemmatimonadaceae bacterium]|nr:M48 family metallopeptidase [Gemmatimonadaceae bacterium]